MANWEGWKDKIEVVRAVEDSTVSEEDREVLRNIFIPLSVALASGASRSQLYHDLALCQTRNDCTVLEYDPDKDKFLFKRKGKPRSLDPSLFIEKGFKVCRQKDTGDVYIRYGKPLRGRLAVKYTEDSNCDPGDEYLGNVHIHPAGAVFPSGMDMLMSILGKYGCIAGKVYDPEEKKEYARVFCHVTDDAFIYEGEIDPPRIMAEFPEMLKLKRDYDIGITDVVRHYGAYTLRIKDKEGGIVEYIFPPRTIGVLNELVQKVKEVYKDTHKFEFYTVDLSRSEPPSLSSLEK